MASARRVVTRVVEIELGEHQLRVGILGVDLQRLFGSGGRGWRILGCERPRHANVCRRPVRRLLEHLLEGLQRLRQIEGLEEEATPGNLDGRVGASRPRPIQCVGVLHPAEGLRGAAGAKQCFRIWCLRPASHHAVEVLGRGVSASVMVLQ